MSSRVRAIFVVVLLLILVGDGVALKTIDTSKYPSRWDSRIAGLAAFVEDARHLRFDHPINVRFLTSAEYKKEAGAEGNAEITDEDKTEMERVNGQARALGLISKDTDLFKDATTVQANGTDAFYDGDKEEMVVLGTDITVYTRVTLVHELTHALDDQRFEIDRDFATDGAALMYQAINEGDATRIEDEYLEQLEDDDYNAYFDEQDKLFSGPDDLEGVAPTLLQLFDAPYSLGGPMTALFTKVKGVLGLNEIFENPPQSEEGMFNVFKLLDKEKPNRVAAPKLQSGEKLTEDAGDFGAISWYLVLASFIDEKTALHAVDGWGGDSYVGYKKDGRTCVRLAFVGDTDTDTQEMHAALDQWKTFFSPEHVSVTGDASRVELSACEPDVVPTPQKGADESLQLPIARMQLISGVFSQGAPRAAAECFSREFIDQIDLAKAESIASDPEALFALGKALALRCSRESTS